jgi:hypothetical protein
MLLCLLPPLAFLLLLQMPTALLKVHVCLLLQLLLLNPVCVFLPGS